MNESLPTVLVHAIDPDPDGPQWLVHDLWGACAVGIVGGTPKACKSMMALDLAVSVASGTACLGRFEVHTPGPVVVYLAEDALPSVRDRVAQLCSHRGLSLPNLNLHVVTSPSLRLDLQHDQLALHHTLAALKPKLLVLDPLVRLHRLDENSAADISGLLGFLRDINRRHQLAIVLVHHMAKRSRRDLGQALRGSSDLHAWVDSACYLVRRDDQRLRLTVEHRAAPSRDPVLLRLAAGDGEQLRLLIDGNDSAPPPLSEAIRSELRRSHQPLSRTVLRKRLHVNNARLGDALQNLEKRKLVVRGPAGWTLPPEHESSQTDLFR